MKCVLLTKLFILIKNNNSYLIKFGFVSYKFNMNTDSESKDNTLTRNSIPTDDEDVTFFFFYDIVKQLILIRNDIGGNLYYKSTSINVIINYNNKRI